MKQWVNVANVLLLELSLILSLAFSFLLLGTLIVLVISVPVLNEEELTLCHGTLLATASYM